MQITDFAALVVAIAVVVAAVFLVTAANNLNNTLAKLEDTANQLRDEGLAAFRELRQLVSDADAELDKVDLVLDRADQATTAISETSKRTHQAVQDPMIRTLAVATGTTRVARSWLQGRRVKDDDNNEHNDNNDNNDNSNEHNEHDEAEVIEAPSRRRLGR